MVVSTVAGISLVGGVFTHAPGIQKWHPPTMVASLGASAVLDYNAIRSPLAQPRNAVIGHTLSAIVGVAIAKLFMLNPVFFAQYDWVAAAVACATASLVMAMTGTVHPPGGATAILACTEDQVIGLGWRYPAIMLVASLLMLCVACIFNNTLRQYPVFWWTPEEVGQKLPYYRRRDKIKQDNDTPDADLEKSGDFQKFGSGEETNSERTLARELSHDVEFTEGLEAVPIAPYKIRLPPHIRLSDEEVETLQGLMARLRMSTEVN